jgi:hypothetical protein
MPKGYTTRKLEVFAIHAHLPSVQQVDYRHLFATLAGVPRASRIVRLGGKVVAVPILNMNGSTASLTAYEGEEGNPIFFDFERAVERIERLRQGEMLTTKTHGIIDIPRREAIIEFNFRGAKAADIAATFAEVGRDTGLEDLSIEFTPVIDEEFMESINRFQRIRMASVKVARPNFDWGDQETYFEEVAGDSNAQSVELSMYAERQSSLAQHHGLVEYIRRIARAALPSLKSATITGIRADEDQETTISLKNHIEHQRVPVRMTEDGIVDDADIERKIENFRRSRSGRN